MSGSARDYRDAHPQSAVLVVEVADTTLAFDREQKKQLYARAGISECWIISLIDQQLDVYRDSHGEDYRLHTVSRPTESVSPLATPETKITVSELIP